MASSEWRSYPASFEPIVGIAGAGYQHKHKKIKIVADARGDGQALALSGEAGDARTLIVRAVPHQPIPPPSKGYDSAWLHACDGWAGAPAASGPPALDDVPKSGHERVALAVETWRSVHQHWRARSGAVHQPAALLIDDLRDTPVRRRAWRS